MGKLNFLETRQPFGITLQFTGRFTRSKSALGDATMIANIADADVEDRLQELYAEDADWNSILRQLSEGATAKQVKRSEFLARFDGEGVVASQGRRHPRLGRVGPEDRKEAFGQIHLFPRHTSSRH